MTHDKEYKQDEATLTLANQRIELDRATLRTRRSWIEHLPLTLQQKYLKARGRILEWYWVPGTWSWAKWVVFPLILWLLVLLSMV